MKRKLIKLAAAALLALGLAAVVAFLPSSPAGAGDQGGEEPTKKEACEAQGWVWDDEECECTAPTSTTTSSTTSTTSTTVQINPTPVAVTTPPAPPAVSTGEPVAPPAPIVRAQPNFTG